MTLSINKEELSILKELINREYEDGCFAMEDTQKVIQGFEKKLEAARLREESKRLTKQLQKNPYFSNLTSVINNKTHTV